MTNYEKYNTKQMSFDEFFQQVAKDAGISYDNSPRLDKICNALESGDKLLNTIPLVTWDRVAMQTETSIRSALVKNGTNYCLGFGVCTHKAAARLAASKVMNLDSKEVPESESSAPSM